MLFPIPALRVNADGAGSRPRTRSSRVKYSMFTKYSRAGLAMLSKRHKDARLGLACLTERLKLERLSQLRRGPAPDIPPEKVSTITVCGEIMLPLSCFGPAGPLMSSFLQRSGVLSWERLWVELRGSKLVAFEASDTSLAPAYLWDLSVCTFEGKPKSLELHIFGAGKKFVLRASSMPGYRKWVEHIKSAVSQSVVT